MSELPVVKFGGTALQGAERFGPHEDRLLEECSKLRAVNDIYRLLAQRRNSARANRLRQVAREFILPLRERGQVPVVVVSAFDWATDKLEQLATAITLNPEPGEYARLLMSGELRANSALAMTLEEMGCHARSLTGREAGIVTTGGPVEALIERVEAGHLKELVANALDQPCCTMFSDVEGVYDRDPSGDKIANKLERITAEELLQFHPLPKVIQREAIEHACEHYIDIWIRSAFDPDAAGTLIVCS